MDMSLDQPSPFRRFLRTWRREIIRGGVLFGLVVGAGLFIGNVKRNIRMPSPMSALNAFGDFNWGDGDGGDLFGHGRETGAPWEYRVLIKPSQQVWIKNTNGPIDVIAGWSDTLVVHAEKSWRNSDPESVQLVPVHTARGVTICAMWQAREMRCQDGGEYRLNGVKKNDVAVRIMVELPRSVPIEASTINGGLQIEGVSAPVEASTVNGRIAVNTSTGPVKATTVNGAIEAVMQSLTTGDVRLITVNGSVTAGLPPKLNANIDAETVNGRVETMFPVKITGKVSPRHLRGTIGNGGPTLKLITVNGSISLHEVHGNPDAWNPQKPQGDWQLHAPHPKPQPRVRVQLKVPPHPPQPPQEVRP